MGKMSCSPAPSQRNLAVIGVARHMNETGNPISYVHKNIPIASCPRPLYERKYMESPEECKYARLDEFRDLLLQAPPSSTLPRPAAAKSNPQHLPVPYRHVSMATSSP